VFVATSLAGSTHRALPDGLAVHGMLKVEEGCTMRSIVSSRAASSHFLSTNLARLVTRPVLFYPVVYVYLLLPPPQLLQLHQHVGPARVDVRGTSSLVQTDFRLLLVVLQSCRTEPRGARPPVASLSPLSRRIVRCSIDSDGTLAIVDVSCCMHKFVAPPSMSLIFFKKKNADDSS
jgi:hypothetical protein